jgi:hypothetical protein
VPAPDRHSRARRCGTNPGGWDGCTTKWPARKELLRVGLHTLFTACWFKLLSRVVLVVSGRRVQLILLPEDTGPTAPPGVREEPRRTPMYWTRVGRIGCRELIGDPAGIDETVHVALDAVRLPWAQVLADCLRPIVSALLSSHRQGRATWQTRARPPNYWDAIRARVALARPLRYAGRQTRTAVPEL